MPEPEKNIHAEFPASCSREPRAGFACGGTAEAAPQAIGPHTRCDLPDPARRPADLS